MHLNICIILDLVVKRCRHRFRRIDLTVRPEQQVAAPRRRTARFMGAVRCVDSFQSAVDGKMVFACLIMDDSRHNDYI